MGGDLLRRGAGAATRQQLGPQMRNSVPRNALDNPHLRSLSWVLLVRVTMSRQSDIAIAYAQTLRLSCSRRRANIPGQPFEPPQKPAYFVVIFLLAPFQIATGAAMSPSVLARFPPGSLRPREGGQ